MRMENAKKVEISIEKGRERRDFNRQLQREEVARSFVSELVVVSWFAGWLGGWFVSELVGWLAGS